MSPAEAKAPTGKVAVDTQRMSGPSLKTRQNGWYRKGSTLSLTCYERGQSVTGYYSPWVPGRYSNIWYKVSDGYWVADIDINTNSNNPVTGKCSSPPPPPPPTSTGRNGWSYPIRPHATLTTYPGHDGDDFPAPRGTPIYAMKGGTASKVTYDMRPWCPAGIPLNGLQNEVRITSRVGGATYTFVYAHLSKFAPIGTTVTEGQIIGYVGMTGCATGNHLHLGVKKNGVPTTPRALLGTSRY